MDQLVRARARTLAGMASWQDFWGATAWGSPRSPEEGAARLRANWNRFAVNYAVITAGLACANALLHPAALLLTAGAAAASKLAEKTRGRPLTDQEAAWAALALGATLLAFTSAVWLVVEALACGILLAAAHGLLRQPSEYFDET